MENNTATETLSSDRYIVDWTIASLEKLSPLDNQEEKHIRAMLEYLRSDANHFSRHEMRGHFTASIMLTQDESTLLLFHKKLQKWLQPGGHMDPSEFPVDTALREMNEEIGIAASDLVSPPRVLLGDVHFFPAINGWAEHSHFDIRFHGILRKGVTPKLNLEEGTKLKWFSFNEVLQDHSTNLSVRRSVQKIVLENDFLR